MLLFFLCYVIASYGSTQVGIEGTKWTVNGVPLQQREKTEGLLFNARLVNGIMDDANPNTRGKWAYPDTGKWDPTRNTDEFVGNMTHWRNHGMRGFTIGLQGGCPECYCIHGNPWEISAFDYHTGELKADWQQRLKQVLTHANTVGMIPIVQYFYGAQFAKFKNPSPTGPVVSTALTQATNFLINTTLNNFVVEVYNEKCDDEVGGMIQVVKNIAKKRNYPLLVSTSCSGGKLPSKSVLENSDFVLVHGNGQDGEGIHHMVQQIKQMENYKQHPKPIVFNEDDHGNFTQPDSNLQSAVQAGASWGFLCCCGNEPGHKKPEPSDYVRGYQCPPVDWSTVGTCEVSGHTFANKTEWFDAVESLTGGRLPH